MSEEVFRGDPFHQDLTVKDSAGAAVDMSSVSGWDLWWIIEGSGIAVKNLAALTVNGDGTVRLALTEAETLTIDPGEYSQWVKAQDAAGKKWTLIDGEPIVEVRDGPLSTY